MGFLLPMPHVDKDTLSTRPGRSSFCREVAARWPASFPKSPSGRELPGDPGPTHPQGATPVALEWVAVWRWEPVNTCVAARGSPLGPREAVAFITWALGRSPRRGDRWGFRTFETGSMLPSESQLHPPTTQVPEGDRPLRGGDSDSRAPASGAGGASSPRAPGQMVTPLPTPPFWGCSSRGGGGNRTEETQDAPQRQPHKSACSRGAAHISPWSHTVDALGTPGCRALSPNLIQLWGHWLFLPGGLAPLLPWTLAQGASQGPSQTCSGSPGRTEPPSCHAPHSAPHATSSAQVCLFFFTSGKQ